MKKIITTFLAFTIAMPSFAIEYVLEWKPYIYKDRATLLKDIYKNRCSDVDKQIRAFESANKRKISNLKPSAKVSIQECYKKSELSDEELFIVGWEELIVPKNFILSTELENRNCRQTYPHQIPKFYEKNNEIPYNVDLFKPGQKIKIQNCIIPESVASEEEPEKKEEKIKKPTQPFHESQVFAGASDERTNTTWSFGIRSSHLNTFTFIGDISGQSNMVRLSYNYFLNDSKKYAIFIEPGVHFATNRTGLANAMGAVGINYVLQSWQLRLSKSVTTTNGVNFYVEKMINDYWGIHFETINYYNRFKDKDTQFNKIGVGFYF